MCGVDIAACVDNPALSSASRSTKVWFPNGIVKLQRVLSGNLRFNSCHKNSSASTTRRQLRNNVYSTIKSVISSVWQSCCFRCVRIVSRGQLCRIQSGFNHNGNYFHFLPTTAFNSTVILPSTFSVCITVDKIALDTDSVPFFALNFFVYLISVCRVMSTLENDFQSHRWTFSRIILWNSFSSYFSFSSWIRTRRFPCT